VATPDGSLDDLRRAVARIETRLESLERRLNTLEQAAPGPDEMAPEPRPER
jgi:ubiquinone biosynthesis protein UbiJ